MFGSDGFARISVQNWQGRGGGARPGLRRVRSDPGLPSIKQAADSNARAAFSAVDAALSVGTSRPRLKHRGAHKLWGGQTRAADPEHFVEDAQSIASSIAGIRSSIEQFQGCKNVSDRGEANKDVETEEDLHDLEHRLLQYRYARRIEEPPPPLSLDPLFEDIPEKAKTSTDALDRNVSPQALRRFHPEERALVIAEQAESRRLRLEAAKAKKMTADQHHQQRWLAEAERYENRMAQLQDVRVQKRLHGVQDQKSQSKQKDIANLQLQERQQQLLRSLVLAYFTQQCKQLKDEFEPTRLNYFQRLDEFSQQRFGMPASRLAKFAAEHYARWQFSEEAQERIKNGCFRVCCREHEMNGKLKRGDVRPLLLPLLGEEEAVTMIRSCRLVEDALVTRCRRIRARKHARCLENALRSWWPSRIMRHLRKFTVSLRRIQTWARWHLKRLRKLRARLESEMLKVERELIIQASAQLPPEPEGRPRVRSRATSDLEDDTRRNLSKHSSKSATDNPSPPAISESEVQRQLLPEAWRRRIVNQELLTRRRRVPREVELWRLEFSTYIWEVWEWRKEGLQGECPKLPPYPSHIPQRDELVAIISEARAARGKRTMASSAGKRDDDERDERGALPSQRELFGDTGDEVFATLSLTQAGTTFYTAGKLLIDEVNQAMLPAPSPRGAVEELESAPSLF